MNDQIAVDLPYGFEAIPTEAAELDLKKLNQKLITKKESKDLQDTITYSKFCSALHQFVTQCLRRRERTISVHRIARHWTGESYYIACSTPGGNKEFFIVSGACLANIQPVVAGAPIYVFGTAAA